MRVNEETGRDVTYVSGGFNHVVTMESADWNKEHFLRVVSDLLYVALELLLNLPKSSFIVCRHVHLVDGDNQLFDAQREGQQSVLPRLTIGGDPSLELSSVGRHDQHGAIGL